jgi:hypothetical protein
MRTGGLVFRKRSHGSLEVDEGKSGIEEWRRNSGRDVELGRRGLVLILVRISGGDGIRGLMRETTVSRLDPSSGLLQNTARVSAVGDRAYLVTSAKCVSVVISHEVLIITLAISATRSETSIARRPRLMTGKYPFLTPCRSQRNFTIKSSHHYHS